MINKPKPKLSSKTPTNEEKMKTTITYNEIDEWVKDIFNKNAKLLKIGEGEIAAELICNSCGVVMSKISWGAGEVLLGNLHEGYTAFASLHSHPDGSTELSKEDMDFGQGMADKYGHEYHMYVVAVNDDDELVMNKQVFYPKELD
jgi:hypothetical protein